MTTTRNVEVVAGSTYVLPFTVVTDDGTGTAVDLTSASLASKVRDLFAHTTGSTVLATGSITIDDATAGQATLRISTAGLAPDDGDPYVDLVWDLDMTIGLYPDTLFRGRFRLLGQVTP